MDSQLALYRLSRLFPSKDSTLQISTTKLGKALGVSQQSASRILTELSDGGFIEKSVTGRGHEIVITGAGKQMLEGMSENLADFLSSCVEPCFEGVVATGLGEGAYYVKAYEKEIEKKVGFKPYPGTLNVKLGKKPQDLRRYTSIEVEGFEKDGRGYGVIRLAPAQLSSGKRKADCFFVLPERTHHREEAEFISELNLREKLLLTDESRVKVVFT
ncbi:MAG: DUF120 domain-containing protein [Methanobacteriota archaeon]